MKNLFLATCAFALLAVSCNDKSAPVQTPEATGEAVATTGKIAYVRIDTLINQYNMYIDLRAAYEAKAQKADTELTSKSRSLERQVRDYQEKIQNGLVTRSQAQSIEEDLTRQQQNFMQHRDKVMGEMAEEEQVMLNQIQYSITEFIKELNKDYQYDLILSTSGSSPILSGNPSMDITSIVLEGLNKKYAEDQAKAPKNDNKDTKDATK